MLEQPNQVKWQRRKIKVRKQIYRGGGGGGATALPGGFSLTAATITGPGDCSSVIMALEINVAGSQSVLVCLLPNWTDPSDTCFIIYRKPLAREMNKYTPEL